jgi:eukaryotic-like serine/threonine-protein kinase
MQSPIGRKFGGFSVEKELGRGGMGLVLLARQESLDRPAVLKRILDGLLPTYPELEARFEREARTAGQLHHPNVVAVYDRFQYRGAHYIATEFVDGLDLAALLEIEGPLPWRISAMIALEVSRGLEAIHAAGTLHRDLKPHNLLIGRQGEVKITDFGLALDLSGTQLTQPGIAVGTPPYMAPEQLRGERVDTRADIFAFGCVLYEMLTGRPPFEMPNEAEADSLLARVESGQYPKIRKAAKRAPRPLVRLLRQCLKAKPARRLASVAEVRLRLERLLDHPSPADLHHTLSGWLWERQVFETRENETVVMVAAKSAQPISRPIKFATAAAALIAISVLLIVSIQEPRFATRLGDAIVAQFSSAPAEPLRGWAPNPRPQLATHEVDSVE